MGGYIMGGLSGPATTPTTDSDSIATSGTTRPDSPSKTAAGSKAGGGLLADGVWYTIIMALLSFF